MDCENDYISSSYKNVPCGSRPCKLSGSQGCYGSSCPVPPRPGCNNYTCSHIPYNPIKDLALMVNLLKMLLHYGPLTIQIIIMGPKFCYHQLVE
ncbi:hypothetical protein RDI58_001629 [Solanum bulbocastanum]|uniref:Uncharacterized protein n=1 Tax=Solanum bulbocastanum TaxID=147425 RepID=A0AAN8UCZ8_SOLBU